VVLLWYGFGGPEEMMWLANGYLEFDVAMEMWVVGVGKR